MASAEVTGIADFVKVETCGHFMCSCKPTLDDEPTAGLIKVHHFQMIGERPFTPLQVISDSNAEKTVMVRRVQKPEDVASSFNNCEGPEITDAGIVCGAIYRLERKRIGREEV